MIIGSHVSFSKNQLLGCAMEAVSYGANTFMFYTGAPQNTVRKKIDMDNLKDSKKFMEDNNIDINNVICHAPYIINLARLNNDESFQFSCKFLKEEIDRITLLGVNYIVIHPGNSLKLDRSVALNNISEALNNIIDEFTKPMILLETMAGKGTECGKSILEIKTIIDKVKFKDKVGVCLDTCHLHDAGVDLTKFDEYLEEFDKIIGIDKIKCIHINDSKNEIASHKDRHANIGVGQIGFDTLIKIIYNPKLKDVPKILETPWINEKPPYKEEIEMIKTKKFNENFYKNEENL